MPPRPQPATAAFAGFPPAALTFLRQLRRHNEREWFEAHRTEYEQLLRNPMREFLEEFDVLLAGTLPEIVADAKRSMFRIHRDVRFSRDKSPYKTHASCWAYHHDAGRGVGSVAHGGAGIYVHLEPGASMIAAGIWMPPKPALDLIRERLLEHHRAFAAIIKAAPLARRFGPLSEEAMLVRTPRGVDPAHPAAGWLRYKSFTVSRPVDDAVMTSPALLKELARDLAILGPMVRWLNDALGFAPASRR